MMPEGILEALRPYLNAILIGFAGFLVAFIVSQIVNRALAGPLGQVWSRFIGSLVALGIRAWTIKLIDVVAVSNWQYSCTDALNAYPGGSSPQIIGQITVP